MSDLTGKTVIVTGAGSGIGLATATIVAQRGASVVLADINGAAAEDAAGKLQADGLSAASFQADVGDEAQISDLVGYTVSRFYKVDALFNNAALLLPEIIASDTEVAEIDAAFFARVLKVNVIGYALCAKHVIPHMLRLGGGCIVNTASASGISSELVRPMYGTSKAAVIALSRSIATQYGKQGIRSISVSPGTTLTPAAKLVSEDTLAIRLRHALLPRLGTPTDIGNVVAFLMSDAASYVTGIDVPVDGGLTAHWPDFADELSARARKS